MFTNTFKKYISNYFCIVKKNSATAVRGRFYISRFIMSLHNFIFFQVCLGVSLSKLGYMKKVRTMLKKNKNQANGFIYARLQRRFREFYSTMPSASIVRLFCQFNGSLAVICNLANGIKFTTTLSSRLRLSMSGFRVRKNLYQFVQPLAAVYVWF